MHAVFPVIGDFSMSRQLDMFIPTDEPARVTPRNLPATRRVQRILHTPNDEHLW